MPEKTFLNPFRPGAGHMPPYLAGRKDEIDEFGRLLGQDTILENMVLTGLRGVGKTVLLEVLKPIAMEKRWLWVGTDLSESATVSEQTIALRLITDLSPITSAIVLETEEISGFGFGAKPSVREHRLNYEALMGRFEQTPGLVADKLKSVLEGVWEKLGELPVKGLIFAYDEAQNICDHPAKEQYPLSLLLDVFQSIQRKNIPFMLMLTGLPTLFPKLVEARTFAERMFHVVFLDRLSAPDAGEAITKPLQDTYPHPVIADGSIDLIVRESGGYPYFIQFICREVFDAAVLQLGPRVSGQADIPMEGIIRKLDTDFFAGRWARVTDRQRELLGVIASLDNCDDEFTVQEVVEASKERLPRPFSASHVNQMLSKLGDAGLVYKDRHGKYRFAVPLFGQFIVRQSEDPGGIG